MENGLSPSDVALLNDNGLGGNAFLILAGGGFNGFGNNNYETARLISEQTNTILQQNNTNLINAIQGFNQVNQNIAAQGASISQSIAQLGYQLDQCCCSIKTQMLQDRLSDTQAQLVAAQGAISNANQSQYLLGQLGRFVAWTPSGSQAATTGS